MTLRTPLRRWAARGSTAALASVALTAGASAAVTGAQASTASGGPAGANPYSPAYHHPYRPGVVPSIPQLKKMRAWSRSHRGTAARPASASELN